ncbi:alcohol dehydrogenase, iron-dependent [Dictyocaulus viviparus]|uniref:hydroxyacid-oxoacid transhydrogenase n=1 Tax=Dictyocaulus viviparus TaxID=29172 RepID=A0A0D8Y4K5_DICVI|nr:alcohol dehydrogenase, iron-dependent [Dictyocaulus viviparus]
MIRNIARGFLERMMQTVGTVCPLHYHDHNSLSVKRLSGNRGTKDYAFEMICSTIRFGNGVTCEIGYDVKNLGTKHALVVTDRNVASTIGFKTVVQSLQSLGVRYTVFDDVLIEPNDESMLKAVNFARNSACDSFVAVGGGSVIDTAKVAALYTSNPDAEFFDFVCPPFGKNLIPPNPILPLIAVPTTAGTGSETTGAAIMDLPKHNCKSGIRQRCIKPLLAIVDPQNIESQLQQNRNPACIILTHYFLFGMPRNVAIYSGFDVFCHALESYTALPFNQRVPCPLRPQLRPLYQGSNPISDIWSLEALKIIRKYFRRSVNDCFDNEAKYHMLLASVFAGIGFGNAGVHLCHGLIESLSVMYKSSRKAFYVSSQGKSYFDVDYPAKKALIPHGLSVVITAAADFEFLAPAFPERHAEAARQLGVDVPISADSDYIAKKLCDEIRGYMRDFNVPNGLKDLGFQFSDIVVLWLADSLETEKKAEMLVKTRMIN